jgi:hypothetical protein
MKYYRIGIRKLQREAQDRFNRLTAVLDPTPGTPIDNRERIIINGTSVRLAVDDFKTILAEIRRLK